MNSDPMNVLEARLIVPPTSLGGIPGVEERLKEILEEAKNAPPAQAKGPRPTPMLVSPRKKARRNARVARRLNRD